MQTLFIVTGAAIGVGVIVFMSAVLTGQRPTSSAACSPRSPTSCCCRRRRSPGRCATRRARHGGRSCRSRRSACCSIDQWQKIRREIRRDAGGGRRASPMVAARRSRVRGDATRSVSLTGIEPGGVLAHRAAAGEDRRAARCGSSTEDVVIGTELAADLACRGRRQAAHRPAIGRGPRRSPSPAGRPRRTAANQRTAYVALRTAQSLLDLPGGVSASTSRWATSSPPRRWRTPIAAAHRPEGGQLDQDQQPVLDRASTRSTFEHALIRVFVSARRRARHRQRAGRLGGAEVARDRHPARHGRLAAARSCACS